MVGDAGPGVMPGLVLWRGAQGVRPIPDEVEHWSMTTLRDKLIKIGAKVVRHGRYVTFQLAEVAISRQLYAEILRLIDVLRPKPAPT